MKRKYSLAIEGEVGSYSAYVPELPTILVTRQSLGELTARAREAMGSTGSRCVWIFGRPRWFAKLKSNSRTESRANMASTLSDPISVPENQEAQIRELRRLAQWGNAKLVGPDGYQMAIPKPVNDILLMILKNLQAGKAVSIVPEHQQLTTQRAANILGVSRPFLVRLVEDGAMPFHMVGSHRRIYLRDLLDYKRRRDAARHEAINSMARAEMAAGTYDKAVLPEGAEDE